MRKLAVITVGLHFDSFHPKGVRMGNVRSLLEAHEAATLDRIAQLRAELVPLERELLEIRLARSALERGAPPPEAERQLTLLKLSDPRHASNHVDRWRNLIVHATTPRSPYGRLTIKELVTKALFEQFQDGATANQLIDLFSTAWGRGDVVRTSLSPQLSRLRAEGVVYRQGRIWRLSPQYLEQQPKTAADQ